MPNAINFNELKYQANGKWFDILTKLGVDGSLLTARHGPCVLCGGKDRFRWDNRNGDGGFFCNQCTPQSGDGFSLVMKYLNIGFPEALEKVRSVVGLSKKVSIPVGANFDPRPALNKLWLLSNRLTGSDMVSRYLHSRGLVLTPLNIRYSTSCYDSDSGKRYHALIARIQKADGKPICLHRIYLENDHKAGIPSPKKLMPATESLRGSSVRLFSSQDKMFWSGILGVAEGIETAIACAHKFSVATWACLSSTLMPSWTPPLQIREIVVFGDNDANYAGQKAAHKLAHILHNKGLIVRVKIPERVGDWADCWWQDVQKTRRKER